MAKAKKAPNVDPKQHWVCEDCGRPNIGESPPDECVFCAHTYFDNLADMIARSNWHDRKVQAGEDVNFSVECNRAGFMLAVHPGVRVGHMKELELSQIEQYYQARHKMESEGRQTTEAQRLSIG